MKKILYILLCSLLLASCNQGKKSNTGNKTQAVLGVKEGGEWVWVTKSDGKEQYEYHGGEFQQISEFKVPEQHTDHSFDIQFEGPGWESDRIGYRIYLDWRNAIDIFGKKVDSLVLHRVGLDGFDSYHEISDWGVDVLKVGSSLGIGSLAFWDGERAIRIEITDSIISSIQNDKNFSEVVVNYYGWQINGIKTDVYSTLEIEEGSYLTKYHVKLSNELPNITTGIVKLPGTVVEGFDDIKPGWNCLITFGIQTLQDDNLGMCIFYKTEDVLEITEDQDSHLVVLKPKGSELTYYFGAAWQQDQSGVSSIEEFKSLLMDQARFVR